MRKVINLADITQDGLLLVKKKNVWILPGGKLEKGEDHFECLYRELKEELSISPDSITIYNYHDSFIGKTPHSKKDLEAVVYFGHLKGKIKPANEISDYIRVNKKNLGGHVLSIITFNIVNSLMDNYL